MTTLVRPCHVARSSVWPPAHSSSASLDALREAAPPIDWYLRIVFDLEEQQQQPEESGSRERHRRIMIDQGQAAAPVQRRPPLPPPACTPVYKLLLHYPLDEHALADPLLRFDAGNRETLFTWTLTLPTAGRLAPPAWLHAHRAEHCHCNVKA